MDDQESKWPGIYTVAVRDARIQMHNLPLIESGCAIWKTLRLRILPVGALAA